MPVGSLDSSERGSGSRNNDGKIRLELLPLKILLPKAPLVMWYDKCLDELGAFQSGDDAALERALDHTRIENTFTLADFTDAAHVFHYGTQKYKPWNWAKGMPWSICIGCAARHITYGLQCGQEYDSESGLSHRGHLQCNLIMLATYLVTYRDGDDRPRVLWGEDHGSH